MEKIVEKCADIFVRLNNLDNILKKAESSLTVTESELQIFPIGMVTDMEKLEKDLEDKTYKKKVFTHLARFIGSALPYKTACYKLAGIMFTKQLLTKYSWTGMSRSLEKKAFNKLTGILDIFFNVVFKSDNSFTYPRRDSFFRDCILKHSNTRLKLTKTVKALAENQEESKDLDETDISIEDNSVITYNVFNVLESGELVQKDY